MLLGTGIYGCSETDRIHDDPAEAGRLATGIYVIEKPRMHINLNYQDVGALCLGYPSDMFVIDSSEVECLTEFGKRKADEAFETTRQEFQGYMERYGISPGELPRITQTERGSIIMHARDNQELTMASLFRTKLHERFNYIFREHKK
ncbi:MAG: hypothetical protein V1740_08100 [Candidatus Woesearchaeota archaeon]